MTPKGILTLTYYKFHKHYWRYLRLVSRKGWAIKLTKKKDVAPEAIIIPPGLFYAYNDALFRHQRVGETTD